VTLAVIFSNHTIWYDKGGGNFMPTKMIGCPHCGTPVSEKKHICHHCQREIQPPAPPKRQVQRITPISAAPRDREAPTVRAPRPKLQQRAQFYRQMQAQLYAGIPPGICLNNIQQGIAPSLRAMVRDLAQATQEGTALSAAMARYPHVFHDWELSLVHAGEIAGTLPESMAGIAEMLEAEIELRLQTNAKTWHLRATAFIMALVICIVVRAKQVLPMLMESTETYTVAEVLRMFIPALYIFLIVTLAYFVLVNILRLVANTPLGARLLRPIIYRLPLIGPILAGALRLRFLRVLGSLWAAGVAPREALETAARASDDPGLMYRVAAQFEGLGQGMSLSAVLAATRYFPREVMYLVNTGEASGSIPEMLRTVTVYLKGDLDSKLKALPMRAQLILYAVMVPITGYLVISTWKWIYEKMFDAAFGGS